MHDTAQNPLMRWLAVAILVLGVVLLWVSWPLPVVAEPDAVADPTRGRTTQAETSEPFRPTDALLASLDKMRLQGAAIERPKPRSLPQQAERAASSQSIRLVGTVYISDPSAASAAPQGLVSKGLFRAASGQLHVAGAGESVGSARVLSIQDGLASVRINGRTLELKTPRRVERERSESGGR